MPEKIGFSPKFHAEVESVGGNLEYLSRKLLDLHILQGKGKFKAGHLFSTPEQLQFLNKTLDSGPMISHWLTTG